MPFPRLVREIARRGLTGSLYLLSAQTKKVVFFEGGQPTFVRSNVLAECLGQVLSLEGLITEEQCEQTLEAIRRTGKKQGELLVEMGILSEGNLRYGLEAQLRAKLYEIFAWEDGRYQFKSDSPQAAIGVRLGLTPQGIILDAIQERYSEERARRALAPIGEQFPHAADLEPLGTLLPEELQLVRSLDGSRSIHQVLDDATSLGVPAPAAFLLGLVYADFAELNRTARPRRPRPPPPRPDAPNLSDAELTPSFEAKDSVTEYEDTPLPGELPRERGILGAHEPAFDTVEDDHRGESGALSDLVAAEPDEVEETFDDDQIEMQPEEDLLDDLDEPPSERHPSRPRTLPPPPPANPASAEPDLENLLASLRRPLDLLTPEELDPIELDAANDELDDDDFLEELDADELAEAQEARQTQEHNPEILGAMSFNEAETAMAVGDYRKAARLLETALKHGFDVAELHAMLAYARFKASPNAGETAAQALKLLDYAESIDPNLDLLHAYRGAIYLATRRPAQARDALVRALELNPYCDLATQLMDQL